MRAQARTHALFTALRRVTLGADAAWCRPGDAAAECAPCEFVPAAPQLRAEREASTCLSQGMRRCRPKGTCNGVFADCLSSQAGRLCAVLARVHGLALRLRSNW